MPELPEVETVCRGLNQSTSNLTIKKGQVLLKSTIAYPSSILDFESKIQGKTILYWTRRGKYLLGKLSEGYLGIHLRMTGQLLWLSQDIPVYKHTRIRLFFEKNQELRFVDTRTFGKFWFINDNEILPETIITGLQKLGLEPFDDNFSVEYLQAKLAKSNRLIKTVLLDQSIIAGIGNIYADEILFQSHLNPLAIANKLTPLQIKTLHKAIIEVLETSINAGGTTFSDFLQVTGVNGNYGQIAWVYRKTGQPCRVCGTLIERIKLAGRSTHFCPQCQQE